MIFAQNSPNILPVLRKLRKKFRLPFQIRKRKRPTIHLLKELAGQDSKIIFDIGANTGSVTAAYLKAFPDADIHSFEPCHKTFKRLRDRHGDNKRVHVHERAVSDSAGTLTFYEAENHATNSLFPSADEAALLFGSSKTKTSSTEQVESITINGYCQEHGIDKINLLKLDIQGGELDALKGASKLLESSQIDVIYSEVEFYKLYQKQPLYHDIAGFLEKKGYSLYALDNFNIKKPIGMLLWCDAVFVSEKILKAKLKELKS